MAEKSSLSAAPAPRASPPPPYDASTSTTANLNTTPSTLATRNGAPPKNRSPLPRPPFPLDLPVLNDLRHKRLVLASSSPRRRQLLAQIGLTNLDIIPSQFTENHPKTLSPYEYVLQTATSKALETYARCIADATQRDPEALLAADTIGVSASGSILEKPRSEAHHLAMLQELRDGRRHSIFTAVVTMAPLVSLRSPGYALESAVEETVVFFDPSVSDDMLRAYVRTREGVDKAGGYGIQGMGALLVERIEGSYENVVGLPLRTTLRLLETVMAKAQADELEDEELDEQDVDEEIRGNRLL